MAYPLNAFVDSVTFEGQCEQAVTGPGGSSNGFNQFGLQDGAAYIYAAGVAEHVAAVVTSLDQAASQPTADDAQVELWISVGANNGTTVSRDAAVNGWDSGSYAVVHLKANSQTKAFEMTAAGIGIGFCGAQLKSDGVSIYMTGSMDMGDCQPVVTQCASAADLTVAGDCSALTAFELTPLGRQAAASSEQAQTTGPKVQAWGASLYPSTPNMELDGTSSDAAHFGPASPSDGVGTLGAGGAKN